MQEPGPEPSTAGGAPGPLLRRYLGVLGVDVIARGANILLLPVYLRLMSQAEFGLYGYLMAVVGTFAMVLNFGIYVAQSKLYLEFPQAQRGEVLFTLNLMLAAALAVALGLLFGTGADRALAALLFREPIDYGAYRAPMILAIVVSVYSLLLSSFLFLSEAIARVQAFNLARILVINGVVLALLTWRPATDAALLRLGGAYAVEAVLVAAFAPAYLLSLRAGFRADVARRALHIGLPVLASALIGIGINLSDRYFLEHHGSRAALSVYNLAMILAGVIPFVFSSFQGVWLPQLLREKNLQAARERSRRMMVRMLVAFALIAIAMELALGLALWSGLVEQGYRKVLLLLPVALCAAGAAALSGMYTNLLLHAGRLMIIVPAGLGAAAVAVALNAVLVPRFDVFGASAATLAANLLLLVVYRHAVTRTGVAAPGGSADGAR